MATRDPSWVKRRRAHLDRYRPRRYPKRSGRKAGNARDCLPLARTDQRTRDARVAGKERLRAEP
jgi:hypothetical protein